MSTQARQSRQATPLQVVKAVLWSFLGIRRRSEHEADALRLKPAHVIVAGLLLAALFVLALIMVVKLVLQSAS
jgi:preprotein translocase subunit Sec61beta